MPVSPDSAPDPTDPTDAAADSDSTPDARPGGRPGGASAAPPGANAGSRPADHPPASLADAPAAAPAGGDAPPPFRIGHGFDLHRLEPVAPAGPGRPFVLGGVRLEHDRGPVGHSDGDALLHAVTDALLGAIAAPDLGTLFSDADPAWEGADSARFLAEAVRRVAAAGGAVANVDATVICERPRIGPHRAAIRGRIAELLGVPAARVNVKGKSHERVDAIGEGRAVAVHATALVWFPPGGLARRG